MTRSHRYRSLLLAVSIAVPAALGTAQAADTVKLGLVAELSGAGAPAGTNWRDGAKLAVAEVNAAGGILGKKVEMPEYDTQTDPQVSRALVQKAIDEGVIAIIGTVYSGSTMVNMLVAKQNSIPQFVGSEAPAIVEKGNPFVYRTSSGAQKGVPALTPYFKDTLKAKKVGVAWVNNEFGKGGRNVFIAEMKKAGIDVVVDAASEQAQTDYAADVAKIKSANPDAVFVYMNQEESARFLIEAKKQALPMPLVGEVTLTEAKVIELAGNAADGAIAHVGVTATATEVPGIAAFAKSFEDTFKRKPTHDAIKGYVGVWATKYVTDKVGKVDGEAFAKTMHGLCLKAADHPKILLDTCWDDRGEMSRPSFMVQVKGGSPVVIGTVPAN
ncbi:ABC transporter substrate-binding protein [Chelatococcus asaccharovorans]|uniref:Amino acid/amide ABC transporter substrate-binding protein (HAAT family) n=1 Tax=Chelatococcus asaccharovorans TaxID=28210 RepID=A0A2V3TWP4_9HYPH|nr:ABC transporter substrate-binding protein [Chelatococcus asaccharovorans]MBS7702065.1 ABC transporter substrate-binding protein [Chelatococcus asaccharovorans]PXW52835.1 amino acid/amide ABC transporter substrate-binding protein (HAAT family) [Chelatococcus asaccharovorans]CAH1667585.1 Amino acid/amide ABC transporter substrate-binding protein (HAAT family) [Chelatococcus asaccharovorans]CAH1680822.1 Amino acid/amide ABC transporter substrate-binding protein (HAAT family) [Chelatococcus asac